MKVIAKLVAIFAATLLVSMLIWAAITEDRLSRMREEPKAQAIIHVWLDEYTRETWYDDGTIRQTTP